VYFNPNFNVFFKLKSALLVSERYIELILLEILCHNAINFQEMDLNGNCISLWPEFSGLEWTFKLLPSKHKKPSI